jgi:hypothetical protein
LYVATHLISSLLAFLYVARKSYREETGARVGRFE